MTYDEAKRSLLKNDTRNIDSEQNKINIIDMGQPYTFMYGNNSKIFIKEPIFDSKDTLSKFLKDNNIQLSEWQDWWLWFLGFFAAGVLTGYLIFKK